MRHVLVLWIINTIVPLLQGSVILARGGNEALFLWDASPYVAQLVAEKQTGPQGLHLLEATAISELAKRARTSRARYLRMKVLYVRTNAVSKVYGSPTFAGVEDVLHLGASRRDLLLHGSTWSSEFARGEPVRGVAVELRGSLPPR
jgi:hypothetical protein